MNVTYRISEEDIHSVVLNIVDGRIHTARQALRYGKHTKRLARTKKMLTILEDYRSQYDLPTRLEGSD